MNLVVPNFLASEMIRGSTEMLAKLFDVLDIGFPSRRRQIADRHVLVWGSSRGHSGRALVNPSFLVRLEARFFVPAPPRLNGDTRRGCQGWPRSGYPMGLALIGPKRGATLRQGGASAPSAMKQ